MKKLVLYFVSILLLMAMLMAGCSTAAPAPADEQASEEPAAEEPAAEESAAEEPAAEEEVVEIELWHVPFTNWEESLEAVIALFEAENPDIKINRVAVPYEEYNEKIAVMVPVGEGPDVVTPYHGWVALYVQSGFLAPLPEDILPPDELKEKLHEAADAMIIDGKYYGVPYYLQIWGLYYNKDHFAEAGIEGPPATWEELREAAIKLTKRDEDGNLIRAGYYQHFPQQEHIVWKALLEQYGQPQFSEDGRTVLWNDSEAGYEAYEWFMNLTLEDGVSEPGFAEGGYVAFYTEQSSMAFIASQGIGLIRANNPDLNYGIARWPAGPAEDEMAANYNVAQYWNFSMTSKAAQDPAKAEASAKFIKFMMDPEAIKAYTAINGGLPPLKSLLTDPVYADDPLLQAFLEAMPYARAIPWVDEKAERQLALDMADRVLLNNEDPREVLDWGTAEEQRIRDEFYAKNE